MSAFPGCVAPDSVAAGVLMWFLGLIQGMRCICQGSGPQAACETVPELQMDVTQRYVAPEL